MTAFLGKWALNEVHNTDALTLMGGLPDDCIDLIVTSPPYDNLRTYNGYTFDFEPIARESYRVLKQGGVLVWVVGDATVNGSETLTSMRQALYFVDVVGFRMHDTMIWNKFLPGDYQKRYVQAFEYMLVLSKGGVDTWNPVLRRNQSFGKAAKGSQRNGYITQNGHIQTTRNWTVKEFGVDENVWRIQNIQQDGSHPAAFPEELARRHILTWSNPGDLVMDYFMGSGTTAKMARNNDRRYIGCDISLEYVELARKRLAQPYTPSLFAETTKQEPTASQHELFQGVQS